MASTLWTYLPSTPGGPLDVDRKFCDRLARETDERSLVERLVVPIRSGKAWSVRAGQLCRIIVIEGPQVADFNCWILPYRLTEFDVHDVLNIFQVTGLTNDKYFMKASPAKTGDFFEFFAEIDLLCAISTCPGGDLSVPLWGPDAGDPLSVCRPLGVEVYEPAAELLRGWTSPSPSDYRGNHGMARPETA